MIHVFYYMSCNQACRHLEIRTVLRAHGPWQLRNHNLEKWGGSDADGLLFNSLAPGKIERNFR